MNCDFCHSALTTTRLFCANCGETTPEGKRVMGLERDVTLVRPSARRVRETSSAAVLSMVFGLLSYVFLPFVGALIAIVTGHFARREIRVSGGRVDGDLLATTGLVLGYSQVAIASLAVLFIFVMGTFAIVTGH